MDHERAYEVASMMVSKERAARKPRTAIWRTVLETAEKGNSLFPVSKRAVLAEVILKFPDKNPEKLLKAIGSGGVSREIRRHAQVRLRRSQKRGFWLEELNPENSNHQKSNRELVAA